MYINPIVVGVLATLGVELLIVIVVGIQHSTSGSFEEPEDRTICTRIRPEELPEVMDFISNLEKKRREHENESDSD